MDLPKALRKGLLALGVDCNDQQQQQLLSYLQLLEKWNIPYEEFRIDTDQAARREFSVVTNGARTVPQILIDGQPIGGYTELVELDMEGGLAGNK